MAICAHLCFFGIHLFQKLLFAFPFLSVCANLHSCVSYCAQCAHPCPFVSTTQPKNSVCFRLFLSFCRSMSICQFMSTCVCSIPNVSTPYEYLPRNLSVFFPVVTTCFQPFPTCLDDFQSIYIRYVMSIRSVHQYPSFEPCPIVSISLPLNSCLCVPTWPIPCHFVFFVHPSPHMAHSFPYLPKHV